jgi:hypothetical protein
MPTRSPKAEGLATPMRDENDDVNQACDRFKQCACSTPDAINFPPTGKNDSNTLRVDANFFINEEKNLRFPGQNIRIRVDGAQTKKRAKVPSRNQGYFTLRGI